MSAAVPEQASVHLRLISGVAACFVVFIHATTLKYDPGLGWGSFTGKFQSLLSHDLFHVALPLFFLNAAFFLFHGAETNAQIWPRLQRRGLSLMMPYLAWSGLWSVVGLFFGFLSSPSAANFMLSWVLYPPPGQFWFLRDLIAMVVLAPLIFFLPRIALLFLSAFAWLWWLWDQTVVTLELRIHWYEVISNEALSWFLLGALAARYATPVLTKIAVGMSGRLLLILLVVWVFGLSLPLPMQIPHGLSVTAGTLFLLGAAPQMRWAANSRWTAVFAGYGFLIYAGHHPAISLVQAWLMRGTSGSQVWHLAVYLLTPLAIIAVLIFVFSVLSRYAPFVVFIANGGRPLPALRPAPQKDPA